MLTLITINYNGAGDTIALLRSLESQTNKQFSVIVVDNASEPEDRAQLGEYAATSPLMLDIIYSDTNRGFSGGNNLAIRKALAQKSEWILLINNDTTVEADFITSLPLDTPGLIGLPIHEGEKIAYAGVVKWLVPTLPHARFGRPKGKLLYVIGAGMLVHQSVFEKVGFLDERYFLYFEDADFSMRVRKTGIPILFVDHPLISHKVSQSTKLLGTPRLLHYHSRNSFLFNANNGPWWARGALPFLAFSRIMFQSIKARIMPSKRAEALAIRNGILDFYAKKFGPLTEDRD